MAIPSRQIGWGTEDNLLWQISKQLEQLTNVTAQGCTTTTTTTTLPAYKVYTALLYQTGGDNSNAVIDLPLIIGVTYRIADNDGDTADFTNVGAPNNNFGTYFVATGTTPTSWGVNTLGQLQYNSGAPTVVVLENTIGNIWFQYKNPGSYICVSDNLFTIDKTTVFISDTDNKNNPTDRLQLRVLCAPYKSGQPGALEILTGTVSVAYEDDVISDPALEYAVTFEIRVYN
jgi:hypothetical protein